MMRGSRLPIAAACVVFLLAAASALAQSEMVIQKLGTTLYHRASCPVIQDMKDVLAMTRAQAEGRALKPHPECDPDNPKAPPVKPAAAPPETVYTNASKYYHRKTCKTLGDEKTVKSASLEVAGKTLWPCPTCRPPIRKRPKDS